jgi:xanthine dehydrogenase accessory factor
MLVTKDGTSYGTIGGGEIEFRAKQNALACLQRGKGGLFRLKRTNENNDAISSMTISIDIGEKGHCLLIIGGGHVAQETARIAQGAGFETKVIETRKEFASTELFPTASQIILQGTVKKALSEIPIDEDTAIVVLNHALMRSKDYKALLETPAPYIGIMASHKHMHRILGDVPLNREEMVRIHCPIGVDIGGQMPYQVGLSLVSEILAFFEGRPAIRKGIAYRPIIVRGAGDLATSVILMLHNAGHRVIALDIEKPTVIRRTVAFGEAMYEGTIEVEGVKGVLTAKEDLEKITALLDEGIVPLVVDPDATLIQKLHPYIVVDAILAKVNIGTKKDDAPLVLALGPGFTAGIDCDAVIETMRGHDLGRVLTEGQTQPNTGTPGVIGGYGKERVIKSPAEGIFSSNHKIGDLVEKGDIIAGVDGVPVQTVISGKLRGLLHSGLPVTVGFKVADVDPRGASVDHLHCSDKGRTIGGGVLQAVEKFLREMK